MTLQHHIITVHNVEMRLYRLVIGDTLGIAALHYAHYLIGQCHCVLIHHLIAANHIDFSVWRYEGYAIECLFGEKHIGNLNNTLFTALLAIEIESYRHASGEILYPKQIHHFQY